MANLRFDVAKDSSFDWNMVIGRITEPVAAKRMPPVYSGHTLTSGQIELIKQWIGQGAKWQSHWSFVAPVRSELPAGAASNPIDRFVLTRLAREGLKPSPPRGQGYFTAARFL